MMTRLKIKAEIAWNWMKWSFWILPKNKIKCFLEERSKLMRRDVTVLCLFVFLIGVGVGQWWRIVQVEPRKDAMLMEMIREIKRQKRIVAQDFINFEIRLKLLEKQINSLERGGNQDDRTVQRGF